jgi:SSS family solute:Na+ symporter
MKNMAALPAYSFILGLLALLGYMAIASGVTPLEDENGKVDANTVVPLLFDDQFPDWFAGVAFSAIAIGALVPAAIMSIAAANLFTRNIYKEYLKPDATAKQEAQVSKLASLVVKFGAVLVIIFLDPQFSIDLQLIGGVVILQTLPRSCSVSTPDGSTAGRCWPAGPVGLFTGMLMLYRIPNPATGKVHFGGSQWALSRWGFDTKFTIYVGLIAVTVNLLVALVMTLVLRAMKVPDGVDSTHEEHYHLEAGDPGVTPEPVAAGQHPRSDT